MYSERLVSPATDGGGGELPCLCKCQREDTDFQYIPSAQSLQFVGVDLNINGFEQKCKWYLQSIYRVKIAILFFFPEQIYQLLGDLSILIMNGNRKWYQFLLVFTLLFLLCFITFSKQCNFMNRGMALSSLFLDWLWPCASSNFPEDASDSRFSVEIPRRPVYGRALEPAI